MEKQTKILLGIGAVIAAYLILKPKKANKTDVVQGVVQDNSKEISKEIKQNDSSGRAYLLEELKNQHKGGFGIDMEKYKQTTDEGCNCFRAPCNCGGGGVKLGKLIPTQSQEY
jgi:hypothetical protein